MAAPTAPDGVAENVLVAVRVRPLNAKEAAQQAVWRPVPGLAGHIQLVNEKEEPVPKQMYAYGA
jgi:hypothetical protein